MNVSPLTTFRQCFPILGTQVNERALVYFDNAATTQKPSAIINSYQHYYQQINANVHRSSHALSAQSTRAFEQSREQVKQFINAKNLEEIIWTKGATESINLIANSWGLSELNTGDEILISAAEHHANIVPWQLVAQKTGAIIKVIPLTSAGIIDLQAYRLLLNTNTKLVCVNHVSNVVGKLNPVGKIIALAKQHNAVTVIDGAQAVGHGKVNVQTLDCDFYVFSAHKMFGPTGLGILYGRRSLLEKMPPYQAGGEMIDLVTFEKTTFNKLPFKFEAGTPNIAAVVAFSQCLIFLEQHWSLIKTQESALLDYAWQKLNAIKEVRFIFNEKPDTPVFSFTLENHHNHDIATALDSYGIAVRSGHHCAMPLMQSLNLTGCLRVSLAAYNTTEEIDFFISTLKQLMLTEQDVNKVNQATSKLAKGENDENDQSIGNEIINAFSHAKSWDEKHRVIMLLGKDFYRMDKSLRSEETLIQGCESLAWITLAFEDEKLNCEADSDAKVIRGLLAIVISLVKGRTAKEIQRINFEQHFNSLGLLQHLSPSRGNGLNAIVEKIKNFTH